MELDEEGFRYPVIDENVCCDCNKCKNICPANKRHNDDFDISIMTRFSGYAGHSLSDEILMGSSSGGIVSQIARNVILENGIVFGVQYRADFSGAEFVKIDKLEELPKIAKSKYVETDRSNLFAQIIPALETNRKVLVIGLPCDIAAVKAYTGNPANLYTCRLVCMSTASESAFYQYVKEMERKAEAKLVSLDLRHKDIGRPFFPTQVRMEFENGTAYQGFWTDQDLYKAFFLMNRESCYHCMYKKEIENSDLIVGDFHGVKGNESYYHSQGVSLFFPVSVKGEELIKGLNEFYFQKIEGNAAINYNWMIFNSYQKSYLRESFSRDFVKYGLRYACASLIHSQNIQLDIVSEMIIHQEKRIFVWGCGDTLFDLYDRLKMEQWNIIALFDGSRLKIGRKIKGFTVQRLENLSTHIDEADIIVTFIPSIQEELLASRLYGLGWNKEIIHVGKYKYYR